MAYYLYPEGKGSAIFQLWDGHGRQLGEVTRLGAERNRVQFEEELE